MLHSLKQGISIRFTVVFFFIFGTLISVIAAISLQYLFSSRIATNVITSYATNLSKNIQENVFELRKKASHSIEMLAYNNSMVSGNTVMADKTDRLFSSLLKSNNELYAAYIGLENGDFYELVNLDSGPLVRQRFGASAEDRFAKVIIEGKGSQRTQKTFFLNQNMQVNRVKTKPSKYDASTRPWFIDARHSHAKITDPYLFQLLKSPGQTISMKIDGTNHVVAVDITLATMSQFFSAQMDQDIGNQKEIFLYDAKGTLISSNSNKSSYINRKTTPLPLSEQEKAYIENLLTVRVSNETDWPPLDYAVSGEPLGYIVEKTTMLAQSMGLSIEHINGFSWSELADHFQADNLDILTPVYRTESNQDWGLFSDPIIDMEIGLATRSQSDYHSLKELENKVVAITSGWSTIPEIKKHYPNIEILEVPTINNAIEALENGRADAVLDAALILKHTIANYQFSDIKVIEEFSIHPIQFDSNLRYMVHHKHKPLLDLINRGLKEFSIQDETFLKHKWLNIEGSLSISAILSNAVPYKELIRLADQESTHNILHRLTIKNEEKFVFVSPLPNISDQYFAIVLSADDVLANSRKDVYISIATTFSIMLLLLPFSWFFANPIVKPVKLLAQENQKIMLRNYRDIKRQSFVIKEIDELSESLVNMSEAIAEHEAQQEHLMDSFIKLIAQAIDDKSPYTGEHCIRIPELGLMLANVASKDQSDYFKHFSIEHPDRQREFRIAAWLHDCGKITTPENIVDKGSKLEAPYNRIHEIRTRFEVIWRDLDIDYCQQLLQDRQLQDNPTRREALLQEKHNKQQALIDDFTFIAECNVGSEKMEPEALSRLEQIANKKWLRHFDDRLGLSPLEEKQIASEAKALPATESLIQDRPEHKIEWQKKPSYEPKLNIMLQAPALQNNYGELYNLSILRGTLNNEERYRIQEHVVSTIKMLESLPFPPELANVPKFASTHHETLKGTGYPRSLTAKDLTIEERILVLADIFEALTADDRPYKKAKSLSVALRIMRNMVLDEHIDKEVFNLFLNSKVYLHYAQKHMRKEQIDKIDIEHYLV